MDSSIGFKIDYIRSCGYDTIRKVPIEELREDQITAIFLKLRNARNGVKRKKSKKNIAKKKKVTEKKIEEVKKKIDPFVEVVPTEKEEQLTIEGIFN